MLSRLDPLTLRPFGRRVQVGEFHDAWSFSPDRSRVALGISAPGPTARVGIRVVDLAGMRVLRNIETGIAATALAWLAPDRLAAVLLSGDVVVVDPTSGATIRRWELTSATPFSFAKSARAPGMLVALLAGDGRLGAARLVLVDRGGTRLRTIRLRRIVVGETFTPGKELLRIQDAGLAVAPRRKRAFVAGARWLAAVDLVTGAVTYHRLPGGAAAGSRVSRRDAEWLGQGLLSVFGQDFVGRGEARDLRQVPYGVRVVDTRRWSTRTAAPRATHARRAGRRLLIHATGQTFGRPAAGVGLALHTLPGRRLRHLFEREAMEVEVAGRYAYTLNSRVLRIVAIGSGKVVHKSRRPSRVEEIELIAPAP